jgi:hypothetical protein
MQGCPLIKVGKAGNDATPTDECDDGGRLSGPTISAPVTFHLRHPVLSKRSLLLTCVLKYLSISQWIALLLCVGDRLRVLKLLYS